MVTESPMGLPQAPAAGSMMLPGDTFRDEVVLITADNPLGRAAAAEFARAGATVVIGGQCADAHAGPGAQVNAIELDVCDEASVAAAFERIGRLYGPVSVLLNNPCVNRLAAVETLTLVQWRALTQPVLDGAFICSTEFARQRRRAGQGGAILNLVEPAFNGGTGTGAVSAARAATINLTQTLAVEWAADDIRVNAIAPGIFAGDDTPALRQAHAEGRDPEQTVPGLRLGQLQEFGWAATFLCSPYAAYMTGAVFVIDGANSQRRGISGPPFRATREWARE